MGEKKIKKFSNLVTDELAAEYSLFHRYTPPSGRKEQKKKKKKKNIKYSYTVNKPPSLRSNFHG